MSPKDLCPEEVARNARQGPRTATSHARLVLVLALLLVLAAGAYGSSAASRLSAGGFTDPSSPSTKADAILAQRFHQGDPNLVFLVGGAADGAIARKPAQSVGIDLARALARQPYVSAVESYWTVPAPERAGFVSSHGRYGLVTVQVLGNDNLAQKRGAALATRFDGTREGVTVRAGGLTVADHEINKQISHDLAIAEAVAVPVTLVALVFVFGGLVAALLPLAMGGAAIVSTLAVLRLLSLVVPVSVYALNLTTALGLGLGIDDSLFIVSRYREELEKGASPTAAVGSAVSSAGRTVLYSSITVGLSMAAMAVFPFYFLRSFAYAGLAVVAVAATGATVVLPALLAVLGRRVNAWDVRMLVQRALGAKRGRMAGESAPAGGDAGRVGWGRGAGSGLPAGRPPRATPGDAGFWSWLAYVVMRRPLAFGLSVLAVLLVLGSPFLSARFGLPDDRVLPADATAHQVGDVLRADFHQDSANELTVVLPATAGVGRPELAAYASRLSLVAGVEQVGSPEGIYIAGRRTAPLSTPTVRGATYFTLANNVNAYSGAGERLVHQVRAVRAPVPALVTGLAARNVDSLNALGGLLPLALALIGLASLAVLYAFTRTAFLPVKALFLSALSLSATFGAMVWVFQEGHLTWLFGGVGATGYVVASMPVLMFCIAFGLSMDYEVFLLSRIKEAWDGSERTPAANAEAVAAGLQRTGPIVTAAAALVSIVFIAVATSQVSFIKLFGVGMALAVLMDATLVRAVLVPAFMRVAGRANWWAPGWLAPSRPAKARKFVDKPQYDPTQYEAPSA